ncbi:SDR family oxidoreductase [Micromonospora sediminimaris]|uniref:SDR family oxidoreductase n=1 Tax=Micromonospora sediminimaris TaxID=547162 RepID=UPI00379083BA
MSPLPETAAARPTSSLPEGATLRHRPQSLLQRLIEPAEIANLVVYLASPLASATTGAAVRVDGGYVDAILP